uniref:Uncharacterized protein LOC778872 n=1 Tax=Phallusia mammillata TaxID=59560 RepID=A0A6F9DK83_9ASCI|nr:uncharacterized protein LOC778872 [Phallusia mammillata]
MSKMTENHHLVILSQMCRVCGCINRDISCRRPVKETKTFAQDLLQFGIDAVKDDPNVHPQGICKSCNAIAKMSSIEENARKLDFYNFQPHSSMDICRICMHPCPACLLVPTKSLPTDGYLRKPLANKEANSVRHKALLKSCSHVCERNKHTPPTLSQKCLCIDVLMKYPEHGEKCGLCSSACHLCGECLSSKTSRIFSIQYVETPIEEPKIGKWAMKRKMAERRNMWNKTIKIQSGNRGILAVQTTAASNIIVQATASNKKVLTSIVYQPNATVAGNSEGIVPTSTHSVPSPSSPMSSSSVDISNDLMPIEFGSAPPSVAKYFLERVARFGSLAKCIANLLEKTTTLFFKYKFTESHNKCVLLGVPTRNDDTQEIQHQLKKLDEFVTNNNLASRAAALEELMFSTDQNESHVNAILHEAKVLQPKTVSMSNQSDSIEQTGIDEKIMFIGNREDFVHHLYQSFQLTYDVNSKEPVRKCYLCHKTFPNQKQIVQHCWKHCQYFDFTCACCKFHFQSPSDMYQHVMKQVCVKEKVIELPTEKTCEGPVLHPLPYKYTGIIPQHYRPFTVTKNVTGSVKASCMLCKFTSSVNGLLYHARQHIGDFPYRCSECKFLSVSPTYLFKHQTFTGHTEYTLLCRKEPLSGQEKQEVMANLQNELEGIFLKGYVDTQQNVEQLQEVNELGTETVQDHIKSTMWMFCQNCNSAFYDDSAYEVHVKNCGMPTILETDRRDDTSSKELMDILVKTEITEGRWKNCNS